MSALIKIIIFLILLIVSILGILIGIAYLTIIERQVLASIQRRVGPNIVGVFGLLQPLLDGAKLVLKEGIVPTNANYLIFVLSPILMFVLSLVNWTFIPFTENVVLVDIPLGILFLFAFSSLSVYGILLAGWSSNSKYAFLGSLRSAAQMISYEIALSLLLICVVLATGSFNITSIIESQKYGWYIIPFFPISCLFFISMLAETNRPPFDLPEAEAELVAGYNIEYSSMGFALFFLAEYANIILMSSLYAILFLGGYNLPGIIYNMFVDNFFLLNVLGLLFFCIKTLFLILMFILVRAAFPRYRYDQLMTLGWKVILPLSLAFVFFYSSFLIAFNFLPNFMH
jgi:NADH-quinone oxidoreductase subunit H